MSRARAIALTYLEDHTCSGCGGDLHKTLVPGGIYDVDTDVVCHSCAALELVRRDDEKKHERENKHVTGRHDYSDGRIYTVQEIGREAPREQGRRP